MGLDRYSSNVFAILCDMKANLILKLYVSIFSL